MVEKSKLAKDEAKRRKKIRDNCKAILNILEKDHKSLMSTFSNLLAEAGKPGPGAVETTESAALFIWEHISHPTTSHMMQAIRNDDPATFKLLMAIKGNQKEHSNVVETHLSKAIAFQSDYDYAKDLLESGSDPNLQGLDGFTTILSLIRAAGNIEYYDNNDDWLSERMALLIWHGADPNQPIDRPIRIWDLPCEVGMTPLKVCQRLLLKKPSGTPQMKALIGLRDRLEARAEETSLKNVIEEAGHGKPEETKKYRI